MAGWGKKWSALALAAAAAAPALAYAGGGAAADALAKLEHGRWVIRSATQSSLQRAICLRDTTLLFQIEHGADGCTQQLVRTDSRGATVEYVCPGRGFGHTSVRVETSKAATIETQGFVDGRPFSYRATARKLSEC